MNAAFEYNETDTPPVYSPEPQVFSLGSGFCKGSDPDSGFQFGIRVPLSLDPDLF